MTFPLYDAQGNPVTLYVPLDWGMSDVLDEFQNEDDGEMETLYWEPPAHANLLGLAAPIVQREITNGTVEPSIAGPTQVSVPSEQNQLTVAPALSTSPIAEIALVSGVPVDSDGWPVIW